MTDRTADGSAALAELQARERIRKLLADYCYHLDMNDVDSLSTLFVEDCLIDYGPDFGLYEGREAFHKALSKGVGKAFAATSHHVSNVSITFSSASEAEVRSHVYALHRYHDGRPDGHVWGQYHDTVVAIDAATGPEWRLKKRQLRVAAKTDFHVEQMHPIGRA